MASPRTPKRQSHGAPDVAEFCSGVGMDRYTHKGTRTWIVLTAHLKAQLDELCDLSQRSPSRPLMYMVGWSIQNGLLDGLLPDEGIFDPENKPYLIRDIWVPARWLGRVADIAFEAEVYRDSPNHLMGLCFHYAIARKPLEEWGKFFRDEEDLIERLHTAMLARIK